MDTTQNQTNVDLLEQDTSLLGHVYGETPASGLASVVCVKTVENIGFIATGRGGGDYPLIHLDNVHFANTIQSLTSISKNSGKPVHVLGVVFPWGAAESLKSTSEDVFKGYLREIQQDFQRYISTAMGSTHKIPFIIPQFSVLSYPGLPENIAQAQLNESFENSSIHLLPAHGIQAKGGYSDNVHWQAETTESIGKAAAQLLLDKKSGMRPISITDDGTKIIITFDGTKGTLSIDPAIDQIVIATLGTSLENNGVRIDSGIIDSVMLNSNTVTVNYSGGVPSEISIAYDTESNQPQLSTTDIWDGINHCCIFKLPTIWERQATVSDATLQISNHSIDSAFINITEHPNYMSMISADPASHTDTQLMDYGKSGYNHTLSGGKFPTISTINSKDSLLWDGESNFLSDRRVLPVADYSFIYVGKSTGTGVNRNILNAYPHPSPQWRLFTVSGLYSYAQQVNAIPFISPGSDLFVLVISYDSSTQTIYSSLNGGTVTATVTPLDYFRNSNSKQRISIGCREQDGGLRDDFLSEGTSIDNTSMLAIIAKDIHNDGTALDIIADIKTYYSIV